MFASNRKSGLPVILMLLCLTTGSGGYLRAQSPTLVLHNGKVLTVDKNFSIAALFC